ncbi:3-oxoacyl-[acyl-carrier-protein] synthase III C-terminal domain-containing protein [Bacillaceae bacterium S4-13-56]
MAYILSIGTSLPDHEYSQEEIKSLVKSLFRNKIDRIDRFLKVFDHAQIENRAFAVQKEWFDKNHSFDERNQLYHEVASQLAMKAIQSCFTNTEMLTKNIEASSIDRIIFVSSTGISTPTIDAHVMNQHSFRMDIQRIPIWGLGCVGGASGLGLAHDLATAYPTENVLLVCVELCSLTFHPNDLRKSNLVGTALFSDGCSAVLVVGEKSKLRLHAKKELPYISKRSSMTLKNSLNVMGWNIDKDGLQVVFSKDIPTIVRTFWKDHAHLFMKDINKTSKDFDFFVAHPGGKKVLEAFEDVLESENGEFKYSYEVLRNHGNMSSPTVLFVLKKWMEDEKPAGSRALLSALGPGFTSELMDLEWREVQ